MNVVNAVILPGLLVGLASPGANAPPAAAGPPTAGKTFAEAVAAVQAALQSPGGEANAPPGDPSAASTKPALPADLLLLLTGLIARLRDQATGTGDGEQQTPLPDRPAGAGVAQSDTNAMETLMAQLLLVRPLVTPDDVITTVAALAPVAPDAHTADLAAAVLQGIERTLASATAPAGDGTSTPATVGDELRTLVQAALAARAASGDAVTAQPHVDHTAQAAITATTPGATQTLSSSAPAVKVVPPSTPAIVAAAAVPDGPTGRAGAARPSGVESAATTGDGVGAAVSASTATALPALTSRPVLSGAQARGRDAEHHDPQSPLPPTLPSPPPTPGAGPARLEAPVNTAATTAAPITVQLANTVQSAVLRGEHEVRLVLNPPELGRVEISIQDSPQGLRVHLQAEQFGARDLIERQLPLLHQALATRDLRVDRLQVSQSGQSASMHWSPNSNGSGDGYQAQGDRSAPDWSPLASFGATGSSTPVPTPRPVAVAAGRVDVMA